MMQRLWLFNLLLAALALICSVQAVRTWTAPAESLPAAAGKGTTQKNPPLKKIMRPGLQPEAAYNDIAAQDLFAEMRSEVVAEKTADQANDAVKQLKISGKKIILYGIVIMDDIKKAMIKNPTPKAGESAQLWIKEGDMLDSLKVTAIEKDRIQISEQNQRYEILLYDNAAQKRREPVPAATPGEESKQTPPPAADGAQPTTHTVVSEPLPVKPEAQPAKAEEANGKFELIETPFGTFKSRKN